MINYLSGKIIFIGKDYLTVLISGVGYKVYVDNEVLGNPLGSEVDLYCHTHVREDQFVLFGFEKHSELALFEMLISVSGVGPRMGLAILSGLGEENVKNYISNADVDSLSGVPGLGKKTAQKVIVELQSKIGLESEIDLREANISDEALQGLMALGYTKKESIEALKGVNTNLDIALQIKEALLKFNY